METQLSPFKPSSKNRQEDAPNATVQQENTMQRYIYYVNLCMTTHRQNPMLTAGNDTQ